MRIGMIFIDPPEPEAPLRAAITDAYRASEEAVVEALMDEGVLSRAERNRVAETATRLVEAVRASPVRGGGLDAFLHEYDLSSKEGIVLMCLAEALLRIPDAETANRLIRDKLAEADWQRHLGRSPSLLVNASTWGLMLTGRLIAPAADEVGDMRAFLGALIGRSGEGVIRQALLQAMRILGRQFVMGRTIAEALERAEEAEGAYRYSYDMLGEAARTQAAVDYYERAYAHAIDTVGSAAAGAGPEDGAGISIKLSALHARYEPAQRRRVLAELVPRLEALIMRARAADIGITIDAEEADRLDLSLDVLEAVSAAPGLRGWTGLGIAVQAYQKRARPVIDWLAALAETRGLRFNIRLVKGAYWDSEIKRAQRDGLADFPVFTRKAATDLSYIACARRLFAAPDRFRAQFATHNAHTVAAVLALAPTGAAFEFQRLHGMGDALYHHLHTDIAPTAPCRVYAPVGGHADLLPYLVRRLLENGANTSFVNRIVDEDAPIAELIAHPDARLRTAASVRHPGIALPVALYGEARANAAGIDLSSAGALAALAPAMAAAAAQQWRAAPVIAGSRGDGPTHSVRDPADRRRIVGTAAEATAPLVDRALAIAQGAGRAWDATSASERAACLDRAAARMEAEMPALMAMIVREAGKTVPDALAEVREAVDYCRYYAAGARTEFASPLMLPGPTGEANSLTLHGRGAFACISPWNFPLAIFTGQIAAALAAGNAVIAKPAEQTPLVAHAAVSILHAAGVPEDVLALLPGPGETVGTALVRDPRIDGVAFTGSVEVAQAINRALAQRDGPIATLIAETGGQNAMIVDSSALLEQVVDDVVTSAFRSAGQRCSALRVLFVQDDIAARLIALLQGAMDELSIGDPGLIETDVGPVIDGDARGRLVAHEERMARDARLLHRLTLPAAAAEGTYHAPSLFEIDRLDRLESEVFGPILHLVRFGGDRLDRVIEAIDATGYGLTLGVHSRIDATVAYVHHHLRIGNTYVNRNMIGAVVGVQPFGGERLSGTGPKAGGPGYMRRFATERVLSVNTSAAGGDAALLSLDDNA